MFAGVYPADGEDFDSMRDALEKLALTDSSVTWQKDSSAALGFGFRFVRNVVQKSMPSWL